VGTQLVLSLIIIHICYQEVVSSSFIFTSVYLIQISIMTDLSTIRVIPFYGNSEEWPTWSETFLAKARRYGFKDVLLGKVKVPRTDEDYDMESEEGQK
jgi:hypothetical protein